MECKYLVGAANQYKMYLEGAGAQSLQECPVLTDHHVQGINYSRVCQLICGGMNSLSINHCREA